MILQMKFQARTMPIRHYKLNLYFNGYPLVHNVRLCLHTALLGEILAVSISEIQSYSHINGAIVVLKAHSSNTIGCRKSPGI